MLKQNDKRILSLCMLFATALIWGAGFVLTDQLLTSSFNATPALLNTIRFSIGALCLLAIFNKKIKLNKTILLYGGVGGILLFAGFLLQIIGQKYTTPAHSGFFTASYIVFVPFISWIFYKKRPKWISLAGVVVAITGLTILNLSDASGEENTLVGDLLTLASALMFALQIAWADFALKRDKTDHVQMAFWQIAFAATLFLLYSLAAESKNYAAIQWNLQSNWWRIAIISLGGTAFAYFAQTYAQKYITSTETSLMLSFESPSGAIISIIVGSDVFGWKIAVGGTLVLVAILLVEVVPNLRKRATDNSATPPQTDEPAAATDNEPTPDDENTSKHNENAPDSNSQQHDEK